MSSSKYAVVQFLQDSNGAPRTQSEITYFTGVDGREMRRLASQYPQTFLGTNEGYKLVRAATGEELDDTIRILLSRAEKIMHRARSLQRYTLERNKVARRALSVAASVL